MIKKVLICLVITLIGCNNNPQFEYHQKYTYPDGHIYLDSSSQCKSSFTAIKSVYSDLINNKLVMSIEPKNIYDTVYNDSVSVMNINYSVIIDRNKNYENDAGDLMVSVNITMFNDSQHNFYYTTAMVDSSQSGDILVFQNNSSAIYSCDAYSKISSGKVILEIQNTYGIDDRTPMYYITDINYDNNSRTVLSDCYP